jgi:hypothetical protein
MSNYGFQKSTNPIELSSYGKVTLGLEDTLEDARFNITLSRSWPYVIISIGIGQFETTTLRIGD